MADAPDDFAVVSGPVFPAYAGINSAPIQDPDAPLQAALRKHYPHLNLTATPTSSANLLQYANLGHARAELDTADDFPLRWRVRVPPPERGGDAQLGDVTFFAKYRYAWQQHSFVVFVAGQAFKQVQYILAEPAADEDAGSHCRATDALLAAVIEAFAGDEAEYIWVYQQYWQQSRELWTSVQKASWDKVILDPTAKHNIQKITSTFFDSKDIYRKLGVPWKRGVIFHGPPGNGKTISVKAMIKSLYDRPDRIPALYVKEAPYPFMLGQIFAKARQLAPCCLIFEDIETIVTPASRSYFFNEVDGLASNDGILMVASTNYLDRLDPGLSKRPSRFDRKYLFPAPNLFERALYAEFWRKKLEKTGSTVEFPAKLSPAIAGITDGFSFAFMQEAFVASMLAILHGDEDALEDDGAPKSSDMSIFDLYAASYNRCGGLGMGRFSDNDNVEDGRRDDDDDLRRYQLWRVMQAQVKTLRKDLEDGGAFAGGEARVVADLGRVALDPAVANGLHPGADDPRAHLPPTTDDLANMGLAKANRLSPGAFIWI